MNKNINYWTISCNIDDYNLIETFKTFKCIEWKQILNNVEINDIVYVYVGQPYSQIMYKCKINKINITTPSIDDRKYWSNPNEFGNYKRYMEIELLEDYSNNELFTYSNLKQYGLSNIQSQASATETLINYIENNKNIITENSSFYDLVNKKRIGDKKTWLKILNNEDQDDNKVIDILLYLYDCKNYTSNGKVIAKFFNTDVGAINSYIKSFGKRIIDLIGLEEQISDEGSSRRWNIPFQTVPELNKKNIFTWKLRKELVEALIEKYDLIPKDEDSIDDKILQFFEEYPYNDFCELIEQDLVSREYFIKKFTLNNIMSMTLDDFVIGKAEIDDKGRDSFCYLIERTMQHLGQMRGSFVSKFGVWYSKDDHDYKFTKKYGATLEEAFENLKKEICLLLVSANNNDFEKISKCEIANIFKGKILSTYYPEKYLCIFDEEDVDKFLNILDIKYDVHVINTLEKKKNLLIEYKNHNKYLSKYSDYYYVLFLYITFKNELKTKNTISGEIDYNLEFVDFEYLKKHEVMKKNSYRSRDTDYEKINRNKKDIGNRGENAVLQNEINKLKSLGLNELAEQVCVCDNDAIGYDIISYDDKGNEIHIEVKTNSSNKSYLDFYITDNELQHLIDEDNYYIYYLFNIKGKPKCHIINKKKILKNNKEFFQPVIYKVNVDVLEK